MGGAIYFNTSSSNSLSGSFGIGVSALNAARVALQTIGHNIANVNTPGYSRQSTVLTTRPPQVTPIGAIGRGVDASKIEALRDSFIEAQLTYESQEQGRLATLDLLLERLEAVYNPTNSIGLADASDNLFGAFQDLTANPESLAQREAVMQTGEGMASASNHVVQQLKDVKKSVNEQMKATVSEINTIIEEIATLNVKLAGSENLGQSLEDLRDQRNYLYRRLNELIGVQGYEDEDGALTITTGGGTPLVIGNQHAILSTTPNALDSNTLDVIATFNNAPANITKLIRGGTMGALIEIRDTIVEDALSNQRLFAAILADSVNIEHHLGTDLSGNAGGDFFTDPFSITDNSTGANIDSITQVGDNATYEINYSVTSNITSAVSITDINIDEPNVGDLTKHDYIIRFTGAAAGDYEVVDLETQNVVATGNLPGAGTITFQGMSVDFDGQPNAGDEYTLSFDGRIGMTGDVYSIVWTSATDYEIYNVSEKDPNPVATGTLAGNGFVFFDGLAVHLTGARAAGDTFRIDYAGLEVDPNLTASTIAASGSAPGLAEPGNNEAALRLANLAFKSVEALQGRTFSFYQGSEIASIGNQKASVGMLRNAQDSFVSSLNIQREAVSGVSLDEEAADLIQYQQSYTAAARYISQVNDLLTFLINALGQ